MVDTLEAFTGQRQRLFGLAYRMLGSAFDAEDVLQEAFLNWQAAAEHAAIASPAAYLTRIVTRLCIDHLRLARVQREQYVGTWLPEPLLTAGEPSPDDAVELADSLSTAFLVVLERLSPVDRAVLLLHDVFGYTYAEIAPIVERNAADVRQIGHRARQRAAAGRPRYKATQQEAEQITAQFIRAMEGGSVPDLFAVLAEDVTIWSDSGGKVRAVRNVIRGVDRAARLFSGARRKFGPRQLMLSHVNAHPAILEYEAGRLVCVTTLTIEHGRVTTIYRVSNPDKLKHFLASADQSRPQT